MGKALIKGTDDPIRTEYDRLAHRYDQRWFRYIAQSNALALEMVSPSAGETVLDVGSGTGRFLEMLNARSPGFDLMGVDLSPRMLSVARDRLGNRALLAVADAEKLPFPDASFDWVISTSMFHYLSNPGKALQEWRRVLKPSGRLRIVDWCSDYRSIRLLDGILRRFNRAHNRTWSERELSRVLRDTRFRLTSVEQRKIDLFWGLIAITAAPSGISNNARQIPGEQSAQHIR